MNNKDLLNADKWLSESFLKIANDEDETPHLPFEKRDQSLISEKIGPGITRLNLFNQQFAAEFLIELDQLKKKDERIMQSLVKKKKQKKTKIK